jgi:hypothetical protein
MRFLGIIKLQKGENEMNKIYKIFPIVFINLTLIYGMGIQPSPPPPPEFVSLNATSTPYQAPLFLADTNGVTLNVKFSFYSPTNAEGKISVDGTSTVPTPENNSKNFTWNIPQRSIGAGMSFKVWNLQELFCDFNFRISDNSFNISNLDFGTGFLINAAGDVRARLDFGFSYIPTKITNEFVSYDLYYGDTTYMSSKTNDKNMNFFAAATIQTAFESWPVNPFVQVSYCPYTFFTIVDTYSRDVYFTSTAYTISPGITYRLSNKILLVAGGSMFIMSDIQDLSPPHLFSGYLQANFSL